LKSRTPSSALGLQLLRKLQLEELFSPFPFKPPSSDTSVVFPMNYIEWNNALAKRYFDDVTESQTFLCITRDTLKDISGLSTEQAALDDFIAAVKNGPEWTQISGCWSIPSKAHNCLHPIPSIEIAAALY